MRKLSEYGIPIVAVVLTLVIVARRLPPRILLAKDTLGTRVTALPLVLYATGLCGIFAWVWSRFGRPRGHVPGKSCYRRVLEKVSHLAGIRLNLKGTVNRRGIHAGGNIDNELPKRE